MSIIENDSSSITPDSQHRDPTHPENVAQHTQGGKPQATDAGHAEQAKHLANDIRPLFAPDQVIEARCLWVEDGNCTTTYSGFF